MKGELSVHLAPKAPPVTTYSSNFSYDSMLHAPSATTKQSDQQYVLQARPAVLPGVGVLLCDCSDGRKHRICRKGQKVVGVLVHRAKAEQRRQVEAGVSINTYHEIAHAREH